jgi:formate/nitrite transporter FocA (FNT family)
MTAYLLGNVIGRLILTYAIIWLAIWLGLAKLDWRDAFRRTNHWTGLTATTTAFLLGLIAAQSNGVAQ